MKSTKTDKFTNYGSGASVNLTEGSAITLDMIDHVFQRALNNFGYAPIIIPSQTMQYFGTPHIFVTYPEYGGTPWAETYKLTKREHAVAKIHTALSKLGVLNKVTEDDWSNIRHLSIKRLKRAKWARYNKGKS